MFEDFNNLCTDLVDFTDMAPLPPLDQRNLWLRYQVVGYTEEMVHDFKHRLETIFGRQVNRVHILDFKGLTPDMRQDLAKRMRMIYTRDDGQEFILALGLHTAEEMAEDGFGAYWHAERRKSVPRLSGGHLLGICFITLVCFLSVNIYREIGDDGLGSPRTREGSRLPTLVHLEATEGCPCSFNEAVGMLRRYNTHSVTLAATTTSSCRETYLTEDWLRFQKHPVALLTADP
ncbi:hypothetical protein Tco_0405533 [Tanacetum coccineum]